MAGSIPNDSGLDPPNGGTSGEQALRVQRADGREELDRVAVEEPLEIRVQGLPYAITLRTPGHDEELALGFLFAERVLTEAGLVTELLRLPELPAETRPNVLDVRLSAAPAGLPASPPRLVTSACGLCGRQALASLAARAPRLREGPRVTGALLADLPRRLRRAQPVFAATGGLHGAALFDSTGNLLVAREDVGRHNAVDKLVGWALASRRVPLAEAILVVSGRAGFEILQKAWLAGIPIVVAVSAPSSLSVALAREAGMTLVGFARGHTYNVYSAPERLLEPRVAPAGGTIDKET